MDLGSFADAVENAISFILKYTLGISCFIFSVRLLLIDQGSKISNDARWGLLFFSLFYIILKVGSLN